MGFMEFLLGLFQRQDEETQIEQESETIDNLKGEITLLNSQKAKCLKEKENYRQRINVLEDKVDDLKYNIASMELNELKKDLNALEQHLQDKYTEIKKFAYKNKGLFKDELFSMYPNELIQPDVFLVKQLRDQVGSKPDSIRQWALQVAQFVDKQKNWTSDKDTVDKADVYQDIYASILDPRQDCENHASIVSSIEPEFGIAFGFAGTTGHAWNVFSHDDELWCIETNTVRDTNKSARIFKYKDQKKYVIHYIFTKDRTYKIAKKPAKFGYHE